MSPSISIWADTPSLIDLSEFFTSISTLKVRVPLFADVLTKETTPSTFFPEINSAAALAPTLTKLISFSETYPINLMGSGSIMVAQTAPVFR